MTLHFANGTPIPDDEVHYNPDVDQSYSAAFLARKAERLAYLREALKYEKPSVSYTDHAAHADEQCHICAHFEGPSACAKVAGLINARGWCKLFKRDDDGTAADLAARMVRS